MWRICKQCCLPGFCEGIWTVIRRFCGSDRMLLLITYDVNTTTPEGRRRLSKLAKECCNYGQRVQNSVFECNLDAAKFVSVRANLLKIIDPSRDSLRIYHLGNNYEKKIEQYGAKPSYDPQDVLIL